jgi:hypothetical protein
MKTRINWFGLTGGALTIVVIVISFFSPWWKFTVGDNLANASASPFNTGFSVFGTAFTIPLIWALNVASILTLAAAGIVMLIYSVVPAKAYSKHLLGFAYKKPLFSVLFFVVVLFALTVIVQSLFSFTVPLSGSTTTTLPASMTQGATVSILVSTGFQWPFFLAAIAAGFCIAARLYHPKIQIRQPFSSVPPPPSPPPPPPPSQ